MFLNLPQHIACVSYLLSSFIKIELQKLVLRNSNKSMTAEKFTSQFRILSKNGSLQWVNAVFIARKNVQCKSAEPEFEHLVTKEPTILAVFQLLEYFPLIISLWQASLWHFQFSNEQEARAIKTWHMDLLGNSNLKAQVIKLLLNLIPKPPIT